MTTYTDMQLDALRELANIGSGTAGSALSAMLGKPVDINIPVVKAMPVPDAVEAAGDPSEPRWGIVVPTVGDLPGHVLLLFPAGRRRAPLRDARRRSVDSDDGRSALGEIGNILGTSYINALSMMLGLQTEPAPPMVVLDMLGAILASVLLGSAGDVRHGAAHGLGAGRRGRVLQPELPAAARLGHGQRPPGAAGSLMEHVVRMGELVGLPPCRRRPRLRRSGLVHRPPARRPALRASSGWRT